MLLLTLTSKIISGNLGDPEAGYCWERDEGVRVLAESLVRSKP